MAFMWHYRTASMHGSTACTLHRIHGLGIPFIELHARRGGNPEEGLGIPLRSTQEPVY